jgi:hypothetical protein
MNILTAEQQFNDLIEAFSNIKHEQTENFIVLSAKNKKMYDKLNSGPNRPDKKNIIREAPDKAEKSMPELPGKDIRTEGSDKEKHNAVDGWFNK